MIEDLATAKPIVAFLKVSEGGEPYLQGSRCSACGEVQVGDRYVCPKCGARDQMAPERLATTGKLFNYTVVHRNYPGIPVPFISAIVELEGGGFLKGNLIDIEPDPEKLTFDMLVDVVFDDAGRTDSEGNAYLAYFFKPQQAA